MSDNILESYLVKLGAGVDSASFTKFNNTIKDSGKTFGDFSLGTITQFAKIESTIVGMFAAIGTGIISLADKTAMADQSYRLMGLRMLMGKDAARAMSMATDDLGASLDEIAYDPELNKRFQALFEREVQLGKVLGKNFDGNMKGIRDLRTEFKFFGDELNVLTMGSVSKLFEKLGFGNGDVLNQLDHLTDWFMSNIPKWSDEIASALVPAWNDSVAVVKDWGSNVKMAAGDFQMLIGILSGDQSIQTTQVSVESLTKSFEHLVNAMKDVSDVGSAYLKVGMHGVTSQIEGYGATLAWLKGDQAGHDRLEAMSDRESQAGWADLKSLWGVGDAKYNADLDGGDVALDGSLGGTKRHQGSEASTDSGSQEIARLAQKVSADTGLPANLIYAQWEFETGKFTNHGAKDLNNLGGVKIPGTDTFQKFDSLDQYADAYEKIITSSRYVQNGIKDAKTPEEWAHALKAPSGTYYGTDSESGYAAGIRRYMGDYAIAPSSAPISVEIHNITVPPNSTPEETRSHIAGAISDAITERSMKTNRNLMAQVAAGAYN